MSNYDRERQFHLNPWDFISKLDLINWYRYFFIVKKIISLKPKMVLEIGPGEGTIKRILEPFVETYETMDINEGLKPNYSEDIRNKNENLHERFDCVIAADILEHIPFENLELAISNLRYYTKPGGKALITIPHRASYFLWMTPAYVPHVTRVPTGFASPGAFYRRFIKRKIWIDPDHEWETGDGHHKIADVEQKIKSAGFKIDSRQTLLYVDFWTLSK